MIEKNGEIIYCKTFVKNPSPDWKTKKNNNNNKTSIYNQWHNVYILLSILFISIVTVQRYYIMYTIAVLHYVIRPVT